MDIQIRTSFCILLQTSFPFYGNEYCIAQIFYGDFDVLSDSKSYHSELHMHKESLCKSTDDGVGYVQLFTCIIQHLVPIFNLEPHKRKGFL